MIIKKLLPEKKQYFGIGLMSGTSLDGLDICHCAFAQKRSEWEFEILNTKTYSFPKELYKKLKECRFLTSTEIYLLDLELGKFIGQNVQHFVQEHNCSEVDFVASHGHTVFHQPEQGLTLQIGNGHEIALTSRFPVVNDFRQKDVSLGGQGAPLVPIGDLHLFKNYKACLNLGGIANISIKAKESITAYDICPMNLSLNYISKKIGLDYDPNGENASKGQVIQDLMEELEILDFYKQKAPKSLGIEWLDKHIFNLIDKSNESVEDLLHTLVEHQTNRIAFELNQNHADNCLITGGGAWNSYFIERLQQKTKTALILPDREVIEFKEALIFAFLGLLYLKGIPNVLSSVTGSSRNSVSGVLHLPY